MIGGAAGNTSRASSFANSFASRPKAPQIASASRLAEDGKKYKIGPNRLLYALRWPDRGEPPDLDLTLVRDPATWFDYVSILLFGALNRHDPHLFDRLRVGLN